MRLLFAVVLTFASMSALATERHPAQLSERDLDQVVGGAATDNTTVSRSVGSGNTVSVLNDNDVSVYVGRGREGQPSASVAAPDGKERGAKSQHTSGGYLSGNSVSAFNNNDATVSVFGKEAQHHSSDSAQRGGRDQGKQSSNAVLSGNTIRALNGNDISLKIRASR